MLTETFSAGAVLPDESNPTFKFENFFHHMIQGYHVDMVGWPFKDSMRNTSHMRRSETRLIHKLLHSTPPGIYFIKLTDEEVEAMAAERQDQQMNGETIPPYIPCREPAASPPPPVIQMTSDPTPMPAKRKRSKPTNARQRSMDEDEEMLDLGNNDREEEIEHNELPPDVATTVRLDSPAPDNSVVDPATRSPALGAGTPDRLSAITLRPSSPIAPRPPSPITAPSTPFLPVDTTTITTSESLAGQITSGINSGIAAAATTSSLPTKSIPALMRKDQPTAAPSQPSSPSRLVATSSNKENLVSTTTSPVQPHSNSTSVLQPTVANNTTPPVTTSSTTPKKRVRAPPKRFQENGIDDVPLSSDVEHQEGADNDDDDDDDVQPVKKKRKTAARKPKAPKVAPVVGSSKAGKASSSVTSAALKRAIASTKAKKAKLAAN